jgi:hypothetical protein
VLIGIWAKRGIRRNAPGEKAISETALIQFAGLAAEPIEHESSFGNPAVLTYPPLHLSGPAGCCILVTAASGLLFLLDHSHANVNIAQLNKRASTSRLGVFVRGRGMPSALFARSAHTSSTRWSCGRETEERAKNASGARQASKHNEVEGWSQREWSETQKRHRENARAEISAAEWATRRRGRPARRDSIHRSDKYIVPSALVTSSVFSFQTRPAATGAQEG